MKNGNLPRIICNLLYVFANYLLKYYRTVIRRRLRSFVRKISCGNLYEIQVCVRFFFFFFGSCNTLRNEQNGFNEGVQYNINQNHLVLIYYFRVRLAKIFIDSQQIGRAHV